MPESLILDEQELGLRRVVVDVGGLRVAVRVGERTEGRATILLHGAAGSWTTWTPLLRAAARAGAPLRNPVIPDLPGWGETPPDPSVTEVGQLTDVVAAVAAQLGFSSWRVVGHSLGGFVALDLAARRPDATVAVGLVSPTGQAVVDAIRRPARGGRRLAWFAGMLAVMRLATALGPLTPRILRLLDRVGLLSPLASPLFAERRQIHPSVISALARELRPTAFLAAARAAGRYDLGRWAGIVAPVRSVRGGRDVFSGVADGAAFAARIADFAEHRLAGAGHFAAIEQPAVVVDLLRDVLGQPPGAHGS